MKRTNPNVLTGVASGSITGGAISASNLYSASFQFVTTDTAAAGSYKVQMSNDANANGDYDGNFTPTNWSDIPSATSTVTAGVGAPILLTVMAYRYIRVVFTRSAGTGTVNVNMLAMAL